MNRCLDWAYWKLRDLLFALDAHWPAGRLEGRIQPREMWGEAVEVLGPTSSTGCSRARSVLGRCCSSRRSG